MSNSDKRKANLSPNKRRLLERMIASSASTPRAYPLSYAQQRFWFVNELETGNPAYNIVSAMQMKGAIDPEALDYALKQVVQRHEILRTRFREHDGQVIQCADRRWIGQLERVNLRGCKAKNQGDGVNELIRQEMEHPFDLRRGPLLRAKLLEVDNLDWVLILNMHHIISDGWSSGILAKEVVTLYRQYLQGMPATLPSLRIQYGDFAVWQRNWLQGPVLEKQLQYWKKQLSELTVLELPVDHARTGTSPRTAATYRLALDTETTTRLNAFSRQEGVTLFMTLLAGLMIVLGRWAGREDVAIGTDVANRNRRELEDIIGLLLNQLVLRTNSKGNPRVRDFLKRIRRMTLDAYAHQDVPFERIVEELNPARTSQNSPLFQVKMIMQKMPTVTEDGLPGIKMEPLPAERRRTQLDLLVSVVDTDTGIVGDLVYDAELYDPITIQQLAAQWHRVLLQMINGPNEQIGYLRLLGDDETRQLIDAWDGMQVNYTHGCCLHELIERACFEGKGRNIAIEFEERQVSYQELNEQANRLAHYLRSLGVGVESRVAICLERSPEMVIAMAAVLKAGAAYVGLDPRYPQQRLYFMFDDASIALLLTDSLVCQRLPTGPWQVVELDLEKKHITHFSNRNLEAGVPNDCAAYVIYTSGSTGQPKGVVVSHRSAMNYINWAANEYAVHETWAAPVHTSFAFDLTITSMWVPFSVGARLTLLREGAGISGLKQTLDENWRRPSLTKLTPAHLRGLELLQREDQDKDAQRKAGTIVIGGEALGTAETRRWIELGNRDRLFNEFGPTEATVGCCIYEITGQERTDSVPIGTPIANTYVRVLDGEMELAPVGAVGELYVGGLGLARGYLNRQELTAERFVPDPFGREGGERLYKTGDRVRWLRHGTLEFLGRVDTQVKLRGYRIELGEIETMLRDVPGVAEAAVVVREGTSGEKTLVAYVTETSGSKLPAAQEFQQLLRKRLPEHMVPGVFQRLDSMPLTENGKLDRRMLPVTWAEDGREYTAPTSKTEESLCNIWAQVLGRQRVGIDDNFFELGGDSLLSLQLTALASELGIKVGVHQIFDEPTVRRLARVVTQGVPQRIWEQGQGDVPLTPIQHWFFERELKHVDHWNQAVLLRTPELRPDLLRRLTDKLIEHHDALRMRFVRTESGSWEQRYATAESANRTFHHVDLSSIDLDQRTSLLEDCAEKAQRSLNLYSGPVFRMLWFHTGPGEGRLLLVAHHLIVDGVSWRILLEDLQQGYQTLQAGLEAKFGIKTASYRDWAEALWKQTEEEWLRRESEYWQDVQRQGRECQLQRDDGEQADAVVRAAVAFDEQETRCLLQDFKKRHDTWIQEVLVTAVARSVASWTGNEGVLLDVEGHGRLELFGLDVSRTVGWFTTIYPHYIKVDLREQPGESLRDAKEGLRSVPTAGIGYGILRYLKGEKRLNSGVDDTSAVAFNYLGQFDQILTSDGWGPASERSGAVQAPGEKQTHGLQVIAKVQGRRLYVEWCCPLKHPRSEAIAQLADSFACEIRALLAWCATSICESPSQLACETRTANDFAPRLLERPALVPQKRPKQLPLSYGQERLWFFDQVGGMSTEYNIPEALRLRGRLDGRALHQALNTIARRHEVLRTRFAVIDGKPIQVIDPEMQVEIPTFDLTGLDKHKQREEVVRAVRHEWVQPFDLEKGPLLRAKLLKLADDDHILLRAVHHIVSDLWSQSVFNREFETLYEAYKQGRGDPLKPLRVQYADFALWQRQSLDDGVLEEGLNYWKTQLAGIPERLELPADRPRPGVQTFDSEVCSVVLPAEQALRLKRFAQTNGVTLYMALLAGFALLLSRYTGSEDIVVGSPIANRRNPQLERLIGFFVNVLVMRIRVKPDASFRQILAAVRQTTLEAFQHGDVPFEKVVQALSPERTLHAAPVYQVLFAFQNVPWQPQTLDGLEVVDLGEPEVKVHSDMEVHAWERRGQLGITWLGNRDLFDRWRVKQMAQHFLTALDDVLTRPDQAIKRVDIMESEERRLILDHWNATARDIAPTVLPSLFEDQARKRPDAISLRCGRGALSYRGLNERANQVARLLVTFGVGPEDIVALLIPPSLEMMIALLGVLKAGAAYLPIDTVCPAERLALILRDAKPACVLTTGAIARQLPTIANKVIALDSTEIVRALAAYATSDLENRDRRKPLSSANSAYVIYTSGSTGVPKGVTVTHRSAVCLIDAFGECLRFNENDVGTLFHSTTFDFSVSEIWLPLANGGQLVIVPFLISRSPGDFSGFLCDENVSVLGQTPLALYQLAKRDNEDDKSERILPLRTIFIAGEALDSSRLRTWCLGYPNRVPSLFNCYGPTEATVFATVRELGKQDLTEHSPTVVSIGRPLANYKAYVLDHELEAVPIGVAGELYLGGPGVARGYLNRPELTAEKFLPDPFAGNGERLFWTGDRARWRKDGNLEYLGRVDDQLKLRGYRVEPGEIEAVLTEYHGVQQAAVIAQGHDPHEKRLVAFVVTEASASDFPLEELRAHLQQRLPEYMVPSEIVRLGELPFTKHGKVDRNELRNYHITKPTRVSQGRDGPRDSTETYVKLVWEDVLGMDLDIRDNFFAVGGHSINSVAVVSRISKLYGPKLSVASIFRYPTIEKFAGFLRQNIAIEPERTIVPIQMHGERPPLFFVHPAGGLGNVYLELARQIGPDQPFYSFQSQGFDEQHLMRWRIEPMAEDYVRELRKMKPRGPYLVGGWSMGGMVAYEMAQQLLACGEKVALLVLLDTVPFKTAGQRPREQKVLEESHLNRQELTNKNVDPEIAIHTGKKDLSAAQHRRLSALLDKVKHSGQVPDDITIDQYARFRCVFARNFWAERIYQPKPYAGHITLLSVVADESDPTRGWKKLAPGRVTVHIVPGPHNQMVAAPNVSIVAAILRNSIDATINLADDLAMP